MENKCIENNENCEWYESLQKALKFIDYEEILKHAQMYEPIWKKFFFSRDRVLFLR